VAADFWHKQKNRPITNRGSPFTSPFNPRQPPSPFMLAPLWKTAALAGLLAGSLAAQASAQQQVPAMQPIYWRQNLLTVPYQWSTPAGAPSTKAVWLYVSKDRGANWQLVSEGESRLLSFNYRAEADGEYWFAVRTTEGHSLAMSTAPQTLTGLKAELQVIVDTTPPRLESLTAERVDATTLEIRWRAGDASLGPQACLAEVQLAADGSWQPAPIHQESAVGGGAWEGSARLQISEGSTPTAVRATVTDLAGNRARSQASIGVDGKATASSPDPSPFSSPAEQWNSLSAAPIVTNRYVAPAEPQLWPADRSGQWAPADLGRSPGAVAYGTPMNRNAADVAPEPAKSSLRLPDPTTDNRPLGLLPPAHDSIGEHAAESARNVFRNASLSNAPATTPLTPVTSDFQVVPPPANPLARRVNTRSFALEYELANVGEGGVATVEAWGTHDGGQTWQRYAVDADNRSPLDVTVDGEGEYGFTIVVAGAGSEASVPPQPGDTPALWVEVDLAPPMARILEVNAARGSLGGELTVNWEAEDDHLEPRPIALFYSSRPTGPWTPIATSIENRGEYTWPIERHVPRRVYLKLEARDAAGNVAAFQTSEPVVTESEPVVAKWQRLPPVE
jgi:hypothetical protein